MAAKIPAAIRDAIGPRVVNGRYLAGHWGVEYTVLAIDTAPSTWMSWSITVATDQELAAGTSRTHCTAWDAKRDRIVNTGHGARFPGVDNKGRAGEPLKEAHR